MIRNETVIFAEQVKSFFMVIKRKHLLSLGSNPYKIIENLEEILGPDCIGKIKEEVNLNVRQLFRLGLQHFKFAKSLQSKDWRQKVSRLYYAAYNVKKSVALLDTGVFSTDSSDHKSISDLPQSFPNAERYSNQLPQLREDRNMCDYDHLAKTSDLVLSMVEHQELVDDFIEDVIKFFKSKSLNIKNINDHENI